MNMMKVQLSLKLDPFEQTDQYYCPTLLQPERPTSFNNTSSPSNMHSHFKMSVLFSNWYKLNQVAFFQNELAN